MIKFINLIRQKIGGLGPGFITGAADNDPSGIATYSITGAQFGYKFSWLSIYLIPLMYTIQEMCGRIGMVSGMGLSGVLRKYYSKKVLFFALALLLIANTINIGADLGFMAASLKMIFGLPFHVWLILITIFTLMLEILVPYNRYSRYLKWMSISVLVYGLTALITTKDWLAIPRNLLIPHIEFDVNFIMALVASLGTTISPYLFFWQASEQVEEEIKAGKIAEFEEEPSILQHEINHMRKDTFAGMSFSNSVFFFVILTTANTLNKNGIFDIETPQQAAIALRPLAGDFAYILFAVGIIGIGLQAVPILAGSAAYAFAEAFGFKEGLAKKFTEAKAFYITIAAATTIGAIMNFIGINPVKALYYTAILNGIVAVPLIAIIIKMADDGRIVKEYKNNRLGKILGWATFVFMAVAVILMISYLIRKH